MKKLIVALVICLALIGCKEKLDKDDYIDFDIDSKMELSGISFSSDYVITAKDLAKMSKEEMRDHILLHLYLKLVDTTILGGEWNEIIYKKMLPEWIIERQKQP